MTPSRRWLKTFNLLSYAAPVVIGVTISFFFFVLPQLVEASLNGVHSSQAELLTITDEAQKLHHSLKEIADLHADSLLWNRDLLERSSRGHVDVPRLIEGNVALQGFGLVTKIPPGLNMKENSNQSDVLTLLLAAQHLESVQWTLLERAQRQARRLEHLAASSQQLLWLVRSQTDLTRFREHRETHPQAVAGVLGLEGAHGILSTADVDELFAAGVRMIGVTHFFDNQLGGSAHGTERYGLTPLGVRVVQRLQELDILVDVAHSSPAVIDDILALTTKPVLASHTGVQGTCNTSRNLSDKHLKGIAASGGVAGIAFFEPAVCGKTVQNIIDAIKYTVSLIGVDHTGLGSDFDGAVSVPFTVDKMVQITQGLLNEGFTPEEIAKIMGGNVFRLLSKSLPA